MSMNSFLNRTKKEIETQEKRVADLRARIIVEELKLANMKQGLTKFEAAAGGASEGGEV